MKRRRQREETDSDSDSNSDSNSDSDSNTSSFKNNKIENIQLTPRTFFSQNSPKNKNKIDKKFANIEKRINDEIKRRNITLNQVFDLNLEDNDYIWFVNYIEIRDSMEDISEEKIKITNMIYQKYNELKDTDYCNAKKLENIVIDRSIIKQIIRSDHTDNVKSILLKKYKFHENKDSSSEEFAKTMEWIDIVLNLPTRTIENSPIKKEEIGNKLKKLSNFLTTKIYGLDKVKEEIIKIMFCRIINPNGANGKILTLIGPPGVGKTAIASTIAEAMGLPFGQISFGSTQDSGRLSGNSRSWVGAGPGEFTKILIKAKRLDSLVLLDEIDKITNTHNSNITNVLIHALDKTQNHRFKDDYLPEVPLDLSQIIFLCSANNIENIDPILRDRMVIINLSGYTVNDKVNIAELYLIPKYKKDSGLDDNEVIFDNKELEYLIEKKTAKQPGMRDVERKLQDFFTNLSMLKYKDDIKFSFDVKNLKFPIKITTSIIDKLL